MPTSSSVRPSSSCARPSSRRPTPRTGVPGARNPARRRIYWARRIRLRSDGFRGEKAMSQALGILSVGAGTLIALVIAGLVVFWFIEDVTQKKHAVLRNYPVIGRLRYFFERQG